MLTFVQFILEAFITEGKHDHGFKDAGTPEHYSHTDDDDDHYYHVAPHHAIRHIKAHGLEPRKHGGAMDHGFYADYSKGKSFFSDKSGVSYWGEKIGQHIENQTGKTPKLKVVKFPKHWVKDPHKDELGSKDSGRGSYYATHTVTDPNHKPNPLAKENLKSHFLFHRHPATGKAKVLATHDSKEELESQRQALHKKGKYHSWDTRIAPKHEYEYHMHKGRD